MQGHRLLPGWHPAREHLIGINKYYILDLRPKNSFIKWAVDQGHTVFVISWVNPDEKLAHKDFEDYMLEGPLAALDAIEQASGERECKVIGYCLGGTLLASMLAYMASTGDTRVKAATFFVSMMDFSEPGELGVFIDKEQLARMDEQMEKTGYFDGSSMAEAFNLLRANDLIWGFVINNYLMGKDPFPFDLLYWNSDSTRMPCKMHSSYLHDLYEKNLLCKPNGISLGGVGIDLNKVQIDGDTRVKAATFFVSMMDFSEPGELGVFIDKEQLARMDEQMEKTGYFDGSSMAEAFNLLRANDLIWGFVINNYLMGKDPFPFDLLYWNSDSTRMPCKMHSSYLHDLYEKNLLCKPNGISLGGVGIDLNKVETPAYFISAKEDHIAPWKSTYAGTQLLSGPMRFVLGMSGHIAGIVNPPSAKKYGYWTNDALPETPDEWLAGAEFHDGSWWPDWKKWVQRYNGKKVPARVPGDGKLEVIEDAPGSYVKVRPD